MNRNIIIVCSLIICVVVSGCGPGEAFGPTVTPKPTSTPLPTSTPIPTTGTIIGTVTNSKGPVEGSPVKLFKGHDNLITETKTDADGNFILENIPAGTYAITYDYIPDGFAIHYQGNEFELKGGETSQQDYVFSN